MKPNEKIAILVILAILVPAALIAFCIIWIRTDDDSSSSIAGGDSNNQLATGTAAAAAANGGDTAPDGATNAGNPWMRNDMS